MNKCIFFIGIVLLFACNSNNNSSKTDSDEHFDDDYKYEYRTGNSGSYNYNYDVSGYDEYGNYVYGNIDIQDNSGEGYIYDEFDNEIYIEVEWDGYGSLEGYDDEGVYYELEVD